MGGKHVDAIRWSGTGLIGCHGHDTAVTIIMAFFTNDAEFNDPDQRAEFAVAMVKKNFFLFSQNRGLDIKVYYIPFTDPSERC